MKANLETKERPILFSGEMVRAILEGRKTQTRRVVKHQQVLDSLNDIGLWDGPGEVEDWEKSFCPYGKPGDRLWVREAWGYSGLNRVEYKASPADGKDFRCVDRWKPSIHMPRCASRITLEITNVRTERLQDISDADSIAEGVEGPFDGPEDHNDGKQFQYWRDYSTQNNYCTPRGSYRSLWGSINGNKHPWISNPWVWVIEFRELEPDR